MSRHRRRRNLYNYRPNTNAGLRQMINNPNAVHNFPVAMSDPRYMDQVRRQGVIGQLPGMQLDVPGMINQTNIGDLLELPTLQLEFSDKTLGKLALTSIALMFINRQIQKL